MKPDDNGLAFFESVSARSLEGKAVGQLLTNVFKLDLSPLEIFDLFDPTYHSYSFFDESGLCVANASVIDLPLVMNNQPVLAKGIQSVATLPAYRGRGLSHFLLEKAIDDCDRANALVFLHTSIPSFYKQWHFSECPVFSFDCSLPVEKTSDVSCRLHLDFPEDRALLKDCLLKRTTVSKVASINGLASMFVLNLLEMKDVQLCFFPLYEAVVAVSVTENGVIQIWDIAGKTMPPLTSIAHACAQDVTRVQVMFSPDMLGESQVSVQPYKTDTVMMVRGALPSSTGPFMFPPTLSF